MERSGAGMWEVWAGSWKLAKPRFEFQFCHLLTFLMTLGKSVHFSETWSLVLKKLRTYAMALFPLSVHAGHGPHKMRSWVVPLSCLASSSQFFFIR